MVGRCWSAAAGYLGVSMMFNDVFQGLGKSKSKGLLLPCCVSKSVFASLPRRSRSLSPALQRVCRNLLSCAFYSRWFEVLGFPESLPQLIPSWPWVALGLRWLQGAQAGHRQLPTRCCTGGGRQGPPLLEQFSAGAPKPALPFTWPVGAGSGFC